MIRTHWVQLIGTMFDKKKRTWQDKQREAPSIVVTLLGWLIVILRYCVYIRLGFHEVFMLSSILFFFLNIFCSCSGWSCFSKLPGPPLKSNGVSLREWAWKSLHILLTGLKCVCFFYRYRGEIPNRPTIYTAMEKTLGYSGFAKWMRVN